MHLIEIKIITDVVYKVHGLLYLRINDKSFYKNPLHRHFDPLVHDSRGRRANLEVCVGGGGTEQYKGPSLLMELS